MYVLAHYQSVLIALREVIERTCIWNQGQNFFLVCVISLVDAPLPPPHHHHRRSVLLLVCIQAACSSQTHLHHLRINGLFPSQSQKRTSEVLTGVRRLILAAAIASKMLLKFCCGKMAEMGNLMREYVPRSDSPSLCPRLGFFLNVT